MGGRDGHNTTDQVGSHSSVTCWLLYWSNVIYRTFRVLFCLKKICLAYIAHTTKTNQLPHCQVHRSPVTLSGRNISHKFVIPESFRK